MAEPEGQYEYRDRVSARILPDWLTWFFRVPAMYFLFVISSLAIWLSEVAGLFPPNMEGTCVLIMTMWSLAGVPLAIPSLVWFINRTGIFLRRSASRRRNLRIWYVILAVVMCGLVQLTGALFGASLAGIFLIAVLLMEVLAAREFATGPRLVEDADAQQSGLT